MVVDLKPTSVIDQNAHLAGWWQNGKSKEAQKAAPLPPLKLQKPIPDGLALGTNKYGTGVFAARKFAKGEPLYKGVYEVLEASQAPLDRRIVLDTTTGVYEMDVQTHTCAIDEAGNRAVYFFDGFMNHSCSPNTYSLSIDDTPTGGSYYQTALRDIEPGEEITCDYDLFEWDARDKGISKCECGAPNCRGAALGFKFLPFDLQCEMIGNATAECVLEGFLAENPRMFYRRVAPPAGFAIRLGKHGYGLIATRDFQAGDVLFENQTELFRPSPYNDMLIAFPDPEFAHPALDSSTFLAVTTRTYFLDHTVKRGDDLREFFGFDSFCAHSCAPNCTNLHIYPDPCRYQAVALHDIREGDELTCDYSLLPRDSPLDGTVFQCDCAADTCKETIHG